MTSSNTQAQSENGFWAQLTKVLFFALIGVNVISLFGYATFGRHPELLMKFPFAPQIFAVSYPLFAQLQMALSFAVMALALSRSLGAAWVPLLSLTVFISGSAEFSGTSWGIPFGHYEYTGLLGAKFLDKVPYLIPLSWFYMAVPSYALADASGHDESWSGRIRRVVLGSIFLLAWDLSLDPAMSTLTPFWLWDFKGAYYGMPLINLFGWFITGCAILVAFEALRANRFLPRLSRRFLIQFYALNLFLPIGMCLFAGFFGAVALSGALLGLLWWLAARGMRAARTDHSEAIQATA